MSEMVDFIRAARTYHGPRRRFYWLHIAVAAPGAARQMRRNKMAFVRVGPGWNRD